MANLGFREVAEMLLDSIESGKFQPGRFIPSEAELCAEMQVSRTTIRRALGVLEAENLLTVVPGRGRLVSSPSVPSARDGESRASFVARVLREEFEQDTQSDEGIMSSAAVAERLRVSEVTARAALKMLSTEGVITAIPGRGWRWGAGGGAATKTDEVAARLRAAIQSGDWDVGGRIPGEMALAEKYGVGRVTVMAQDRGLPAGRPRGAHTGIRLRPDSSAQQIHAPRARAVPPADSRCARATHR